MTQDTEQKPSILRLRQVIARVGLQRASIYRQIAAGTFPAPIPLGIRARGWLESDVANWISSRASVRQTQQAA